MGRKSFAAGSVGEGDREVVLRLGLPDADPEFLGVDVLDAGDVPAEDGPKEVDPKEDGPKEVDHVEFVARPEKDFELPVFERIYEDILRDCLSHTC